jgi:glycine dehydrogenase subunit 1
LLEKRGIVGGYDLSAVAPHRPNQMLVCVTEMNSVAQIDRLVGALAEVAA